MKKICCICAQDVDVKAKELLSLVNRQIGVQITFFEKGCSVRDFEVIVSDFDVVVFVYSKAAVHNKTLMKRLRAASNLNITFIPIILGGNVLSNWILKKVYKGPNLRKPFLTLRKDNHMFAFMQQIAGLGGACIMGDAYGAEVEFIVDLPCKVFRGEDEVGKCESSNSIKLRLFKGSHELKFQSIKYPELTTDVKLQIKDISIPISREVKIARHRSVDKMAFKGGFYEGSLFLDNRDGYGCFWFPNGNVYKGDWKDDVVEGQGVMTYASGDSYAGQWRNGKRHGSGKFIWLNKKRYEGNFVNDVIKGIGICYYSDGSCYDGEWDDGMYNGKGIKKFADGSSYDGDWIQGLQHGYGIEFDSSGNKVYSGEWKNGQKQTFFNKVKNWWNNL